VFASALLQTGLHIIFEVANENLSHAELLLVKPAITIASKSRGDNSLRQRQKSTQESGDSGGNRTKTDCLACEISSLGEYAITRTHVRGTPWASDLSYPFNIASPKLSVQIETWDV
jgi:hypothetical protein